MGVSGVPRWWCTQQIGALAALLLLLTLAPASAARDFPTPAGKADYALSLGDPVPGLAGFSGGLALTWDFSCESLAFRTAMTLAFSRTNGQSMTIAVSEALKEDRGGDRLAFETSASQQGQVVRRTRGTVTRAPSGEMILDLVEPQQSQLRLPGDLMFSMRRTTALVEAARNGADRFTARSFLPASLALYEIRSRMRPAGTAADYRGHAGDALTAGPVWEVAETFLPQGGSGPSRGGQTLIIGQDLVPLRMSLAISGVSVDVTLRRFTRLEAGCP